MLKRLIERQSRRNWHPYAFLMFCVFVGLTRGILEIILQGIGLYNSDVMNFLPFYVLLGLLLTLLLSSLGGVSFQSVQKSLTMGLFIGLFPPLFDYVFFANSSAFYGYYYVWNFSQLPFLGYNPEFNFPAGETLAIWISILFCGLYVYAVTAKWLRAFLAIVGAYLVFVFMGSLLPMLVTKLSGVDLPTIEAARLSDPATLRALSFRIAFYQSLLALVVYLLLRREILALVLRRILHVAPFVMLTILGGVIVGANAVTLTQSTLLIAVVGIAVIVQNDYFDAQQSSQAGATTPLQKFDVQFVNALTLLTLLPIFFHNNRAAIAAAIAFVCGVLYNYPFYRARNYFPANIKIEGVWGLTALLSGLLIEPAAAAKPGVVLIAFLVFGGWSTVAVLKDLKDAEEDRRDGVQTAFTLLMRRGYSIGQIWGVLRWLFIVLMLIPAILTFGRFSALPIVLLLGLTVLIFASFWLKNHKRAFQLQLGLIAAYLGFWQVAFARAWISL